MEKYDYREAVKEDVREYILTENLLEKGWQDDRQAVEERLYDELWTVDSVTGNASGSYTVNAYEAEEYVCHNLDLLESAYLDFGCDFGELIEKGAEAADVTIRCWLLSEAIDEVLDELEEELEDEPDEEE